MSAEALNRAAQSASAPERADFAFLAFLPKQLKRERERVDQLEQRVERAEA